MNNLLFENIFYFLPLFIYILSLIFVSFWYDLFLKAYYDYKLKKYK